MLNTIDPRTALSASFTKLPNDLKKARDLKTLRQECRQFEAIFIQQMYKSMRKTVPDGGLLPKSMAVDTYQQMYDSEMAKKTAAGGGMGLGLAMYKQLAAVLEKTESGKKP